MRKAYFTVPVPHKRMPKKGFRTVTVSEKVYKILELLKEEFCRETGVDESNVSYSDILNHYLPIVIREFAAKRGIELDE